MIRSIFRLAEYIQGNNGYLLHHEIYIYVFDALLMFITMVTFNVVHPQENGHLLGCYVSDCELAPLPDATKLRGYPGV